MVEVIYENIVKSNSSAQTVKNFKHICYCEPCSCVPFTRWAAGFMRGCVTDTYQDKWKVGAPLKQPVESKVRACSVAHSTTDRVVLLGGDR